MFLRHVDGHTATYSQFHDASLRWTGGMAKLGVEPGENVLTMLPNSFEAYEAWLGLAWLGAVEVPLNNAYQGRMLQYTGDSADARVMVIAERFVPRLAEVVGELSKLETVVVPDASGSIAELPQRVVSGAEFFDQVAPASGMAGPEPWDIACIIWTSGTTGPSKGVLVPWAELFWFSTLFGRVLTSDDVYYQFWPPFHASGKLTVYGPALAGVPVVMREVFSAGSFWDDVRGAGVTTVGLAEPLARILMLAPRHSHDRENPLRAITCGPLFRELPEFLDRFGIEGCSTGYGMTEIGLPFLSDGLTLANLDSCGRLREHYNARVVDEHDYPLGPGEIGELIVRSDHPWTMNAGYYGMPDKTAEAWRNGWFHTGDAFRYDEEGNFYFVDRIKDAIRRRGENISSFEIEAYVNEHHEVAETAAVAVPSELGEDEVKVLVVRKPGSDLSPADLIGFLAPRMPRFMVPRFIEFVDELPKTEATFRTQKAKLRENTLNDNTWDRDAARDTPR